MNKKTGAAILIAGGFAAIMGINTMSEDAAATSTPTPSPHRHPLLSTLPLPLPLLSRHPHPPPTISDSICRIGMT